MNRNQQLVASLKGLLEAYDLHKDENNVYYQQEANAARALLQQFDTKPPEGRHQYFVRSETWYADLEEGIVEVINFSLDDPEGGSIGEMSMVWNVIGETTVPQLHVCYDAWEVLGSFQDVLDELFTRGKGITPSEFRALLDAAGFTDVTVRRPQAESAYASAVAKLTAEELEAVRTHTPKEGK